MGETYEAVLFDFDGVLVDSEPIHHACWQHVLVPLGIDLHWDFYHKHFIGVTDRSMAEVLVGLSVKAITVQDVYAQYARKTELFCEEMRSQLPFAPGVIDFIRGLSGYKLGVVTSSRRSEVAPVLEAGGLSNQFSVSVFGDDVTRHKPHPEPYLKAAEGLGVKRVLVVEDSEAGEASGRAAGFDVVRIPDPCQTVTLVRQRLGYDGCQ